MTLSDADMTLSETDMTLSDADMTLGELLRCSMADRPPVRPHRNALDDDDEAPRFVILE